MKVEFLSPLDVEKTSERTWQLLADFRVRIDDQAVAVPAGYVTDFASVPRVPIAYLELGSIGDKAATLHDYLYSKGQYPRAWCDQVFRSALAAEGVSAWRCWSMWTGVRLFGGSHYQATP